MLISISLTNDAGLTASLLGVVGRDRKPSDEALLLGVSGREFEFVLVLVIGFASVESAALYCFVVVEFSALEAAEVRFEVDALWNNRLGVGLASLLVGAFVGGPDMMARGILLASCTGRVEFAL